VPLVAHAPATARRLGVPAIAALDLLELYAFVRPASFCLPTPRGIAKALGLPVPADLPGEAESLRQSAAKLLGELAGLAATEVGSLAAIMAGAGWAWGPFALGALGGVPRAGMAALDVWSRLASWSEHAPEPAPGNIPVEPAAARRRLAEMTGRDAEARPSQGDYASAVTAAFRPREREGEPHMSLAEAGTGVGKTLGYLAPASLWAEANQSPVWVSTFTRNLQHQIDRELDRLIPDPAEKARRVVIRKGRENYLCLLNFEEAVRNAAARTENIPALAILARWVRATRDGDMVGGDFPAWLSDLLGRGRTLGLADQRGECIHSACPHYSKCFIERQIRRARRADIVIANHALVMVQAAFGGLDDTALPTRIVFDEGHHLFDAADAAFSGLLTGQESAELRRWIVGAESGRRSRARGLMRRIGDLTEMDAQAREALDATVRVARLLPAEGWLKRVSDGSPDGPAEAFFARLRQQVLARAPEASSLHGIETETRPPVEGILAAAASFDAGLARLEAPIAALRGRLLALLDERADDLETSTRLRIESLGRSLERRLASVRAWRGMLGALERETPPEFVDWFAIERIDGREIDFGMHRHWIDPTRPLAEIVLEPAHGVVVTSATLRDGTGDVEVDWQAAEARTGARHLAAPALRAALASPFDYPARTRVVVVTDVRKDDIDQVAAAYRELFLAAGGGALGLFTAISRLRAVHARIAPAIETAGLPLLAQHVDALDTSTLIEIFRAEESSCLLGTDAVRDGVDVPGRSLRLIVFDRVPWPRPDILHKARREFFGPRRYDDMLTRLKLRQAFGRLIRRATDSGVFVLLDPQLPSRLHGAFPEGVAIERIGLKDAVAAVRECAS
jgi:ATP-dependent DNA helicase DinG